jgi:hypothetical protein
MDTPLIDQIRYLELRLAECQARPELHRHQIAAYEHQLELARASSSALAYFQAMEQTATTMELARAEWMDRYANWSCVYRALGDEAKCQAARHNHQAAADASPDGFLAAVIAAKLESGAVHQAAEASQSALPSLLAALLDWAAEGSDSVRAEHRAAVQAFWELMRQNDPLCTWQRICEYPPYRQRIPFDEKRLAMLGDWLRQIVGVAQRDEPPDALPDELPDELPDALPDVLPDALPDVLPDVLPDALHREPAGLTAAPGRPGIELELPSAAQTALPYHMAHDALDPAAADAAVMRALYERIFTIEAQSDSGPSFLRRMAEEGMFCRLAREPRIALAERGLAHCRGHSQPHLEFHYQELLAALARCRSPTEVDYEIERLEQFAAVESAWNDIVLRYSLKTIMAACGYPSDASEDRRRTIAQSHRIVHALFGRDWDAMLRTPRVWDFLCRVLYPRGQVLIPPDMSPGLYRGELGFAAVEGVREAAVWRVMAQIQASFGDTAPTAEAVQEAVQNAAARPVFETPEALGDHLTGLFRQAMAGVDTGVTPVPSSRQELFLWGRAVHLDDLLGVIEAPPRPPVPLVP